MFSLIIMIYLTHNLIFTAVCIAIASSCRVLVAARTPIELSFPFHSLSSFHIRESTANSNLVVYYSLIHNLSLSPLLTDTNMFDCFLEYPRFNQQGRHAFHFQTLHQYQQRDPDLCQLPTTDPNSFFVQQLSDFELVCRRSDRVRANDQRDFQIVLSNDMLRPTVKWYMW